MSKWRWCVRLLPVAAIDGANLVSPVSAQPIAPPPSQLAGASLLPGNATWVVNFEAIPAPWAQDDDDALGTTRALEAADGDPAHLWS